MRELTPLEEAIYNNGERLIFGITHDISEDIRHRSSYIFFKNIIIQDLPFIRQNSDHIKIIDLGCGIGHGCKTLSEIEHAQIVGVDSSPDSLKYAQAYYAKDNITFQLVDLIEFIPSMSKFDYVLSRGVFEQIPNGLTLALSTKWNYRLIFDVPYNEPAGNPHHVLLGIREEDFAEFPNVELFYQDLDGIIYDVHHKPPKPNMIICVCSRDGLPKVANTFTFPVKAWKPKNDPRNKQNKNITWLAAENLFPTVIAKLEKVDTVLDIGCGIRPQELIVPKVHICCEPFTQYIEVLQEKIKNASDRLYIIMKATCAQATMLFPKKSVDSIFLVDVIEHLPKRKALKLLKKTEEIARRQMAIFSPIGFMPQSHPDGKDAWGLNGGSWQEHKSGWLPEDFDDSWEIYASKDFHKTDNMGKILEKPYGAFWAIKNLVAEDNLSPA